MPITYQDPRPDPPGAVRVGRALTKDEQAGRFHLQTGPGGSNAIPNMPDAYFRALAAGPIEADRMNTAPGWNPMEHAARALGFTSRGEFTDLTEPQAQERYGQSLDELREAYELKKDWEGLMRQQGKSAGTIREDYGAMAGGPTHSPMERNTPYFRAFMPGFQGESFNTRHKLPMKLGMPRVLMRQEIQRMRAEERAKRLAQQGLIDEREKAYDARLVGEASVRAKRAAEDEERYDAGVEARRHASRAHATEMEMHRERMNKRNAPRQARIDSYRSEAQRLNAGLYPSQVDGNSGLSLIDPQAQRAIKYWQAELKRQAAHRTPEAIAERERYTRDVVRRGRDARSLKHSRAMGDELLDYIRQP